MGLRSHIFVTRIDLVLPQDPVGLPVAASLAGYYLGRGKGGNLPPVDCCLPPFKLVINRRGACTKGLWYLVCVFVCQHYLSERVGLYISAKVQMALARHAAEHYKN